MLIGEESRIKGGIGLKYLMGLNAAYINTDDLTYQFQNDHVVNVEGSANYGHSTNLGEDINFKPAGSGFGFDLGAKYSFKNQYIFGVSLLDVGSIKFDRNVESQNFIINQQNWDLDLEQVNNIADLFHCCRACKFRTRKMEFKMGLPTTLSLQATANLWESGDFEGGGYQNLYLNVTTYHDLSSLNSNKEATMKPVQMVSATVGFVSLAVGAGIPITISNTTGLQSAVLCAWAVCDGIKKLCQLPPPQRSAQCQPLRRPQSTIPEATRPPL